jgi:Protein of unknown function (DUF4229)
VKAFAVYTSARLLLLAAVAVLLYLVGARGLVLAALAVLLSLPLSYVLLVGQRAALGAEVERRLAARQARRADLRARLRGDDDSV